MQFVNSMFVSLTILQLSPWKNNWGIRIVSNNITLIDE